MRWSETAWQQIDAIYQQILQHPFIRELMSGSLPAECFKFYITQDALYLGAFSKALSQIAARAQDTATSLQFIRFAEGAVVVEQTLHATFFQKLQMGQQGNPSPTCLNYINFLMSQAALAPVEAAMAAVLPCFWIYKRVGGYIYQNQQSENNPYQDWIDTYAGETFEILVAKAIDLCDTAAADCTGSQRLGMTRNFIMASRFEWMFWNSAYYQEQWPV